MKKLILICVLVVGMLFVQGCTHVGPFVSNIALDGQGNLVVTKQTIKLDPFFGILSSENEQVVVIKMK